MKKFLSAFLAILMVLSMVATSMVTVFAAEAKEADAGANEIVVPSIDHEIPGWEITPEKWNAAFDLKTPDGSNAYLLRSWAEGNYTTNGVNMFWIVETADGCVNFDVSTADTFAIDMYFSDASLVSGKQFQIELANGGYGGIDTNEATYNGTLDALVEGGLKNGWNTIKLPIASMGKTGNGADWTKIDWFRMYNNDTVSVAAAGMQIAIDNVRFLKGDAEVAVMSECEPTLNGWQKNARPIEIDGVKAMGQTWTSDIAAGGYFTFRNQSLKLDISGMKYVEFDVYVSDVNALANVNLMFELRSGSTAETNEWGINAFKAPEKGWVNGWNHVKWELSAMSNTASGTFDATNVVWFRIANHDAIPVDGSLTIAMDNLRFTTDDAPTCKNCHVQHEAYLPKPGTTVPGWGWGADLTLNNTVSVSNSYAANTLVKFCDIYVEFKPTTPVDASAADALTFDFYVSDVTGIENATLEIEIASVQCDNEELNATGKVGALIEGGLKAGWNTVVMPFDKLIKVGGDIKLDNIKWFRIYNQPAAQGGEFTTGANGLTIALDNLRFTKNGEKVATLSDVNPDMKGWERNGTPIMINDILAQGATFTENIGGGAGFNFLYIPGADVTMNVAALKYFEFDWYVSDADAVAGTTFVFELSSSGLPDNQEIGKIFKGADMGLKDGWNRVRFTIADLADTAGNGAFNPEKFNFLRLFNDNAITVDGELTMAFTNIRFADDMAPELDMPGAEDEPETPDVPEEPEEPELPTPVITPTEVGLKEIILSNNAAEDFYNITKPGWAVGGGGQAYCNGWSEVELDGKTGVATTLTGSGNVVTSRFHYYAVEPTDISGMTHFELDLYISDASVVNGKQFIIEIQDTGLWGAGAKSEIRYINNNAQFKNGWNHIKLSLDDDFKDRLGEGCPVLNRTEWQHCRVWFPDAAYTDADITYALGGLKFTNAAYDEQSISVPLVESTKPEGWNWAASLNIKKSGSAAISTKLVANKQYGGGAGAFLAAYNHAGTIDASAAETFRFWLYTDDAAVMKTVQVEMELTSSGTCDNQENAYVGSLDKFVEGGIQNGWNEVIIPLADINHVNGGVDWTRVNFFRMYNQQGFSTADVAMTIALDELAFYNATGEVVAALSGCDIKTDWEGPTGPMTLDDEVVIGNTWEAGTTLGVGWFMFRYGLNVEGKYPEAVDISGMKYIEFDFYVSDAMALINAGFSFELTGEGIQDKNESAYNWDGWRTSLTNGWNHVQWPLSWFNANTAGSCDYTAWNFLRMFNSKDIVVGENGLTVAMKNVEFTTGKYALEMDKDGQPLTEKEIISFTPVQSDKDNQANLDHVIKITSGANAEKFYADATGEVIYRVPVSGKKYVKYVTMSMTTGSQLLFEVSTDGENWTTIYEYKDPRNDLTSANGGRDNGGLEKGLYTFDLTEAVVGEKGLTGDYIYIRIADSYPEKGWGGNLYYAPVTFEIIRTIAPHAIELPAYGTDLEGWNWSSSLNHAEGSFSASKTFAAGQTLGNANILVMFQSKDGEGVDASTADAFEFDLYVSNAAALKDMNVEMELTSGGRPDDHEKRYVNATLSALIEGGMKDGWNHVVLPLSKMGDHDANNPIDWTNVNCFRQYFFAGVNTGDADLVVAYDNLIFTKGGEKVATLSNAEPNTNGWEGPAMDMNGQLVIGKEIAGNKFGSCDIYINYIGEKGIDVSGLKYLEYDIYVSDVEALKNVTLFTEINSSGDYDKNELGYDKTFGDHGLKNGWNRIKIELAKMGDTAGNGACDLTDIKWFRIFTVAEATLTDGLTYAITNVRFTDDKAPEVALPENPDIPDTPDTPAGPPAADSELSIEDAIALGGSMEHNTYTEGKYYVTGVITEVYNTTYGNMKITDDKGNILTIYGTYSADGATRYDKLETKPVVGDTVTIYGIVGQYNGTPQIKNGWITEHIATPETSTKEDLYEFFIDNGAKEAPYLDPDYKANWNGSLRFADASQYFIYKFNLTAFRGVESISFAGNFGGQYHIWASADGKTWIEVAKRAETSPAKSLVLDLSELADDVANTMTLYVKIGDSDTSNGNGGNMNGNVQLKVVYDKNAPQDPIIPDVIVEQEKVAFKIDTEAEKAYLIENDAPINATLRYADAGTHFTYKYTIKNVHQVQSVIWKAKTSQQFKLDISFDNENWVNVFSTTEKLTQQVREYDLTEFLVDENGTIANATFYLKISDADPADGWGGGVNRDADVTLLVDYIALTDEQKDAIEATVTEHCIPLWGANKTWGDIYVTDNENQVSGSGCVSANLKGVSGTHAPSKQFEAVDATGMDTFEFYVYLSDLAIVDHLKNNTGSGSVEICSGGACDQGEKAVSLNQIFTDFVVGELTTGWNEIAIPLNKMAGTPGAYGNFELNKINYIRIFWSGMTNPTDQEWVIKFDNFRMTDRQAAEAAAKVEFENKVIEENKGLIANLEDLKSIYEGEITADNYKSASAKYSAAKSAFDKLDEASQNVLKEKGYYVHISKAKKAIEDYEEAQQILKDNAQLIADLEALAAYKDASAFTFDNYDAAKAAIEAARAAVDPLTKSVKDALADYIAHLTAAEAALPAEKPACTDHVDADKNGKCDKCDAEVPVEPTDCEHVDADGDKKCDKCGEDMGGCKSALTIGALATMILAGAWVTIAARKKED